MSTPVGDDGQIKEKRDSTASDFSSETQGSSFMDEEPKLPLLEKLGRLCNQLQKLKKEHRILSSEVKDELKATTANAFSGSGVLNAVQLLSAEHEVLKKKQEEEYELLEMKYLEECAAKKRLCDELTELRVKHEEECEILKKKHKEEYDMLKKKYLEEYAERKRLYNELIELKGNIRVFCRCRPLSKDENANEATSVVEFDPFQDCELQISCADSSKKQFKFDHVFGPQDSQETVFRQTAPVVTSVLDGFNVCIFAYGQTGTGKTYTMEGTPENRGVNYRTLEELFRISEQRSTTIRYELFVSMLEVYNEKIRDLLVENSGESTKKLEIKQLPDGSQDVPGLSECRVYGPDDVWELLKTGSKVRSVGSTNANEFSSRSHCLLRVIVKSENLVNGQSTKSNLWLVDLAGSERLGRIEVEGERLKESQFINKSLSALGDVISALASKNAHIPYRNSKLTHLLQSSLGGDCKALMFAQISPTAADAGETLCSLNFATRVRGVEHGPARKQIDHSELMKYKQMAEKLKHDEKETKKLQESVQSLQLKLAVREHNNKGLQDKVRNLENQLAEERRLRLNQETRAPASSRPSLLPQQNQETRALAAASRRPSLLSQPQRFPATEKRPPMGPGKQRPPLRRISNFMPPPPPTHSQQPHKTTSAITFRTSSNPTVDKENTTDSSSTKPIVRAARRVSIAAKPTQNSFGQGGMKLLKRRASVASIPSSSSQMGGHGGPSSSRQTFLREPPRARRYSKLFSPAQASPSRFPAPASSMLADSVARRQVLRDLAMRKKRFSKLFSPSRESTSTANVECTPMNANTTSRFVETPPTNAVGSWKPKHPTVVALLKKPLVWSPLRLKTQRNGR